MATLNYGIGGRQMAKKGREDRSADAHYAAVLPAEEAAVYIDALAAALRDNSLVVQTESDSIQMRVGPELMMELRTRTSGGESKKSSIRLSLSWTEPEDSPLLSISSTGDSG
jgi:amphi-Trp domain-containing protein